MIKNIYGLAEELAEEYRNDTNIIDVVHGLQVNTYEVIRECEFLSSGHYIYGDYDEDGELIPFQDIITRILENQRSAEEVDTADLKITTDDPDFYRRALLVDKYNQEWLRTNRIDKFLNDAIETRGKYGGLLVKVVEETDNIALEVVDWNDFTGDAADLKDGLRCIENYYTPSQLMALAKKRGWDMDAVKEIIENYAEEDMDKGDARRQVDTTAKYILVRELSGSLSRQYIDEDADEHDYSYQIHYLAGVELRDMDGRSKGKTLFSAELDKPIYYYLPYKKRGGKDKLLGIGMTERAKHAQVQTNRAAQQYKKALDLASTHVLQTTDKNLKGKNVLRGMKTGTILHTKEGTSISGVDMSPDALAHLDRFMATLQNNVDRSTGTTAIGTGAGEKLPSDMTYRLGAILDQNAQSSFDLRREEFGIFMNQIYQDHILPFHLRQIKNATKLNLKFNPDELQQIDFEVESKIADDEMIAAYFDGTYVDVPPVMRFQTMLQDRQMRIEQMDAELQKGKSRRTIVNDMKKDWRSYWSECEGKLFTEITNEKRKKGVVLEAISNMFLQYLQYKPVLDQDPEARKQFNEMRFIAGLTPVDFSNTAPAQQQTNANAQPIENQEPLATSAKPK